MSSSGDLFVAAGLGEAVRVRAHVLCDREQSLGAGLALCISSCLSPPSSDRHDELKETTVREANSLL
jgi:hypothetical protein